jgi:hypothetical protein
MRIKSSARRARSIRAVPVNRLVSQAAARQSPPETEKACQMRAGSAAGAKREDFS